jgi:hypothetical protein
MHRRRTVAVAVTVMGLVIAIVSTGSAAALSSTWDWADHYTDVGANGRTFIFRTPSVETGMKSAYELSARRDKADTSKGRAQAAVKTRFGAVTGDAARVTYFGRAAEADNDPVATLKMYVHCRGELDSEWVLLGRTDVTPNTNSAQFTRSMTAEDCDTLTVDGMMLQVLTGERGDRRRRTIFLQSAEVRQGGAAVWTEDFTTP